MNQQSPMLRLWELGAAQHGSLIRAILSAVAGVLCGMAPYFAAAQIILGLLSGGILVLPDLVRRGPGRVPTAGQPVFPGPVHLPQGYLLHSEVHPGENFGETPQNASRHHPGYLQRPDEAGHR